MDRLVRSGMKLSECERRVLRMTGRSSPWGLTERSPWVVLKRAMIMSRLLIRRCSRLHHPRSSSKLVTLDVLLYRRRHHWAPRRCILSILYEPLFSTPGRGSQTLEQYSTWGRTSFYNLFFFKVDEFTRKFLFRKPSVRFALAVISSMCRFHLRSFENRIPAGISRDHPPLLEYHAGNKYVGMGF